LLSNKINSKINVELKNVINMEISWKSPKIVTGPVAKGDCYYVRKDFGKENLEKNQKRA
jgi:hypothetical protein